MHFVNEDLLSTAEAAALLGKSVATLNRWATENRITPAVTLPGTTGARLYRRADIAALIPQAEAVA